MIYTIYFVIAMSIIGFIIMGSDKGRAIKRKYRIKEKTIWLISLCGGAIGTTIGMFVFRHKTKHNQFVLGLPLIAAIHIGLMLYLF